MTDSKDKSYEELLGIYQGYQKTVSILTEIQDNITNKNSLKVIKQYTLKNTRNFSLNI